jgi:hypothetical protein
MARRGGFGMIGQQVSNKGNAFIMREDHLCFFLRQLSKIEKPSPIQKMEVIGAERGRVP